MYQRILVASMVQPLSKKAVRSSIELATATGAELVALNVEPRYPMSHFEGAASLSAQDIGSNEKK